MKTTLTALLVLLLSAPAVAQDLPPDVLADKHLLEAAGAIERGDAHGALEALKKVADLEIEPPPMFSWLYGKVLVEHGDGVPAWRRGRSLLARFAIGAGRDSELYAPALELILLAEARMEAAERLARIRGRLPEILAEVSRDMVQVEEGTFSMGCTPEQYDCDADESPVREVRVDDFEIGRYEVTQGLWQAVMGENPSAFADCLRCPVETVGWDDVQVFLQRLNAGGERYRLPSEAEWEYAARAGTRTARWWGDALGTGFTVCDGCGSEWDDVSTAPVGSFSPNPWGLHDMLSNANEWVADCWVESHAGARTDGSPRVAESSWWRDGRCLRALQRGSSWGSYPWSVRAAKRIGGHYGPDSRSYSHGFRIVRPAEAHEVERGGGEFD